MKNNKIILSILTLFILLFTSCKKDSDGIILDLKLSKTEITIEESKTELVKIEKGNGEYKLKSSNDNIEVELNDEDQIKIKAIKEGVSIVEVTDLEGVTASVKVTVFKKDPLFNEIHRIQIITHEGHLHGAYLHGNGGNKTPRSVKQYFILERDAQGNFAHLTKNDEKGYINPGESMVFLGKDFYGEKWTPPYAYEFVFYNKAGERLEGKFLKNKNIYQTLFSIEQYKVLATNEIKNVKTKDFMVYTYRDTKEATKMYSGPLDIDDNFLGFKGYGYVKEARISYTLKVNFVKYKNTEDKVNSIFLEDAKQDKFVDKLILEIPIVIPVGRSHNDQMKIMAAYYNMSEKEYDELFWLSNPAESSAYYM